MVQELVDGWKKIHTCPKRHTTEIPFVMCENPEQSPDLSKSWEACVHGCKACLVAYCNAVVKGDITGVINIGTEAAKLIGYDSDRIESNKAVFLLLEAYGFYNESIIFEREWNKRQLERELEEILVS